MSAVITNDGFSDVYLYYAIGAAGMASSEFLITMQACLRTDFASYHTYMSAAPTTYSGGSDYWTAADFNTPHRRSIGSDGTDTVHASAAPLAYKWFRMAFQRVSAGGTTRDHYFWIWDMDGTNEVEVKKLVTDTDGLTYQASTRLTFGAPPYTTNEGVDGWIRCVKAWEIPRTKAEALAESASGYIETGNGTTSLWGQYPLRSDGNDISGNARHLSIELNAQPASSLVFDGEPDPAHGGGKNVTRTRRPAIFAPGIAR